jgi:hypothetical protein
MAVAAEGTPAQMREVARAARAAGHRDIADFLNENADRLERGEGDD